jgi:hypothetical protein
MIKPVLLSAALAACSSPPGPGPAPAPWPARAPPQPSQMTGGLEHGMMNCPSAVDGAQTRLRMTATGVDVIVTAADPETRAELAKLAEIHASMDRFTEWPEHTGKHGGPGTIGHCPIIHDGTTVSFARFDRGVVLHVTATSTDRVSWLQDQTAQRLASMPTWLPRAARR